MNNPLQKTVIELQPTLAGPKLLLRPLRANDIEALYSLAADPLIWEQHPDPTRYQRQVFMEFCDKALQSKGAIIVIDKASNAIIGTSRYYDWNPTASEIAIGYTFLSRPYWGGVYNGEMKRLMLSHIFQWADLVWFHIGASNWRSRKALEKIGGELSHSEPRELGGGVLCDYAYYKIVKPR